MIHTIRELIENKSVLILGYGREGRSSWQRIKEAGSYSRIAIADMNHVQLEEGHPAELICGPDYQKCLDDLMWCLKARVLCLSGIFMITVVRLFRRQNCFSDVLADSALALQEQRERVRPQR